MEGEGRKGTTLITDSYYLTFHGRLEICPQWEIFTSAIIIYIYVFETGFLCIALAVLELALEARLASNSELHLPLPPKCWD